VRKETWLAAAGVAAALSLWRRRRSRRREHVDLYFADGSMISLDADSPQAQRVLPLAQRVLAEARRPAAGLGLSPSATAASSAG
jgi:hypothetical protein